MEEWDYETIWTVTKATEMDKTNRNVAQKNKPKT